MGQGNASYWEDRAERLLEAREALTAEQEQNNYFAAFRYNAACG